MKPLTRRTTLLSLLSAPLVGWLGWKARGRSNSEQATGVKGQAPQAQWLRDASLTDAELATVSSAALLQQALVLEAEVVRQWRDGLSDSLVAHAGAVSAWVRWDKAMLLQGLAREQGWIANIRPVSRGVFQVEWNTSKPATGPAVASRVQV